MLHNVAILWDELLEAFTNMEADRVYFLDRATGDIFFLRFDQEESVWHQLDHLQDRFLEIPRFDYAVERQLLSGFNRTHNNEDLRRLLEHSLTGRPPYANPADILSFFPEEEERLGELKDDFLSNRVKTWLEQHELFSMTTSLQAVN
ncbi:MAG: UPF0158 family protein [Trichlorobacter sp.]|jgi:hypothetical protein